MGKIHHSKGGNRLISKYESIPVKSYSMVMIIEINEFHTNLVNNIHPEMQPAQTTSENRRKLGITVKMTKLPK